MIALADSTRRLTRVKPAILYERFSPRPKGEAIPECDSIRVQHESLTRYCERSDLEPAIVLTDEYVSGKDPIASREGGGKIESLLESGEIKDVVTAKLDRIFRNTVDGLTTIERWNDMGVSLHIADNGNVLNTGTAEGMLMCTVLLAFASFEPMRNSERTSGSMVSQQANGKRVTSPDKLPFGFCMDHDSDPHRISDLPSRMVPHEGEQAIIRIMRDLASFGWTHAEISAHLNSEGHRTRCGRKWVPSGVGIILSRPEHSNARSR